MNRSPHLPSSIAALGVASALAIGCAEPPLESVASVEQASCSFAVDPSASRLVAVEGGLVVAYAAAGSDAVAVERMAGERCAMNDGPRVTAARLLDADEGGGLYVFRPETRDSTVTRIAPNGARTDLVYAGRGVWSFGIAPDGDALWVTACGPTGIFEVAGDAMGEVALAPPESLWEQTPSVLTDGETFWSIGVLRGDATDALDPEVDLRLVRTTKDGSQEVAPTLIDFGSGLEQATLSRCGDRVCGLYPSGLIVWSAEGEVATEILLADIAADGEALISATGRGEDLFVLLRSSEGARVVWLDESAPQ